MESNFPGETLKANGDHASKKGEGVGTLTHQLPSVVALVIKWGLLWGGATILPWVKPALCEAEWAPVARESPWCSRWQLEAQPVCRRQHLLHLSPILPFTLKDISLSLNLYIQTSFSLDDNERSNYPTNRLHHIGYYEGSIEANAQEENPGCLFQAALMIRVITRSCTE